MMKIYLDVDDVLADTVKALEGVLGPAVDPTSEDIQDFFPGVDLTKYLQDPAFNRSVLPVEGALEGTTAIFKLGHEIHYLSARMPHLAEVTETWLQHWHFPGSPLHCVGREIKRTMLETETYDLLIDDQLKYLNAARDRGLHALAYAYPWNQTWEGSRLKTWKALADEIQTYQA